jgi:hypothetical protein
VASIFVSFAIRGENSHGELRFFDMPAPTRQSGPTQLLTPDPLHNDTLRDEPPRMVKGVVKMGHKRVSQRRYICVLSFHRFVTAPL